MGHGETVAIKPIEPASLRLGDHIITWGWRGLVINGRDDRITLTVRETRELAEWLEGLVKDESDSQITG